MIQPTALYDFARFCPDSVMVGNVVRALCGQDVNLSAGEMTHLAIIRNENEEMDKRITTTREKWARERAERRTREKNSQVAPAPAPEPVPVSANVPRTNADKHDVPECPADNGGVSHTYLLTNLPTYLPTNNKKIDAQIASAFERVWVCYPKKVGKKDALKSFTALLKRNKPEAWGALCDAIVKSIKAHLETDQWQKDGGQFIPYPATFINQERWTDEMVVNTEPPPPPPKSSIPVQAKDWVLCEDRCACCVKDGVAFRCTAGVRIPYGIHPANNQRPPEECPRFMQKQKQAQEPDPDDVSF